MTETRPVVRPPFLVVLACVLALPLSVLAIQWTVDAFDSAHVDAAGELLGRIPWPASYIEAPENCETTVSCFRTAGDPRTATSAVLAILEEHGFTTDRFECGPAGPSGACQAYARSGRVVVPVAVTRTGTSNTASHVAIGGPFVP